MGRGAAGRLSFERAGEQTVARAVYAESPLRLLTPRCRGPGAMVFTSTFGGGLLDGDSLKLDVEVSPGARAGIFSQGPTRVFRSPGGVLSKLTARVADEAALVLAPDPVACFAGARFDQQTSVELTASGSLVLQEVLSGGRDVFRFSRFRSSICVRRAGLTLLDEALLLDQAHGDIALRFGRFQALATLVVVGPLFDELRQKASAAVGSLALSRNARLVQAASPLGDALVVRIGGETVEAVLRALRGHLSGIPAFLGNDPWRRDAPLAA
ncbi:MAG TPA: urease accessory protein UreD [Myxococcales bacterium]|nr:urease accessory protein UreD [Myxococcales bacterium]